MKKLLFAAGFVCFVIFMALSLENEAASPEAAAQAATKMTVEQPSRLSLSESSDREPVAAAVAPEPVSTTGSVSLSFAATNPVDFKVTLLQVGKPIADGRQESTEGNQIVWEEVSPGDYRWRLDTVAVVRLDPPFETPRVVFDGDGTAHPKDPVPSDLSGTFSVQAGKRTELRAEVVEHSTITGVCVEALQNEALDSIVIRLRHREIFKNPKPGAPDVWVNDTEGSGRPDQFGRFMLTPVKPGDKLLTVSWRVGDDFFYSTQAFSVEAGETKDLGGIFCQSGMTVSGVVQFRLQSGELVSKEQLFGEGVDPKLDMVLNSGADVPSENGITEFFHPALDRPFTIHGLTPGSYFVVTDPAGIGWPRFQDGLDLLERKTSEVEFDVRKSANFEVNFLVESMCQYQLTGKTPGAEKGTWIRGCLVNAEDEFKMELAPSRELGVSVGKVSLPAGRYELWLRSVPQDGTDPASGWSLRSTVIVPLAEHAEETVTLETTESLRVLVKGVDGSPAPNAVVMFSPQSLGTRRDPVWLYRGKANQEGFLNLGGLISGESLIGSRTDNIISPHGVATVIMRER